MVASAPSGERTSLLPDAPRADVAARLLELAALIERGLPTHVAAEVPWDYATASALLLTRMAGLARSVAELVLAGRDLDAGMLMRATLEHVTLLAWLAIEPAELSPGENVSREWAARDREENARWWVASQFAKDLKVAGLMGRDFPATHDEREHQDALKTVRKLFATERSWGPIPRLDVMAAEADARWGGRLPGWPAAEAGEPGYDSTLRGFDLILKHAGNTSAHPHLGALRRAFTDEPNAGSFAPLRAEVAASSAETSVATTAYLLLYAISIAEHTLGWSCRDDALHILGRFADVRHPDLLLTAVTAVLDGADGCRFGTTADGHPISVERQHALTTIVVLVNDDAWRRVMHMPSGIWSLDDGDLSAPIVVGREALTGAATERVTVMLDDVIATTWLPCGESPPYWPRGAS